MSDGISLGVDWYKRGWVAVVLDGSSPPAVLVGTDLEALIGRIAGAGCVGVDMPIGLPTGERSADALARAFVGPRRSSVFMTPPARVLQASTYLEANQIAPTLTGGKKISQQAWALRHNIDVVNAAASKDARVIEVHPEVSFCALVDEEIQYPKGTWNGQSLRREALAREGIELSDHLVEAGGVPVADVLDAAVAAWTARRYLNRQAYSLPEDAPRGQRGVIWY